MSCVGVPYGEHGNIGGLNQSPSIVSPYHTQWAGSMRRLTEYLGFEAYDGEYKVMSLATYGRHNKELIAKVGKLIVNDPGKSYSYKVDYTYLHGKNTYSSRLTATLFISGKHRLYICLLYTSPSPRDGLLSRMPSSA